MTGKSRSLIAAAGLLLLSGTLAAQEKVVIRPDSLPPLTRNYSQGIKVSGGTTLVGAADFVTFDAGRSGMEP